MTELLTPAFLVLEGRAIARAINTLPWRLARSNTDSVVGANEQPG